jgi:site-specific DNA recombinase
MKTAILYIRVSTDEQADKGYSQRGQEETLKRYCSINSISINEVIFEDHSAKTFERPEWKKLLKSIRANKKQTTLVLFTKWDRFSRNAGDAYQMINTLRKLGAEPQAIEQPLDLSVPENKMMLAFYLAAPEVENDRRALNVFHGMRRAKKEGRWMASAPIGYSNKVNEENRKCIVINPTIGPIIFWAFSEIATGRFNTEQVWKMAKEKGLKCSKNAFWLAIRNPVYCGKIFIPPYKDEPGYLVKGQHQELISEQLFSEVQDVIDGRKKNPFNKPKVVSHDSFPLRGFLECHKCGRVLTGSASKGKYNYYNYYHCTAQCGVRFKAESTNEEFLQEIQKYVLKPGRLELYTMAIQQDFKNQVKAQDHERKASVIELENINKRLQNARMMKVDGSLADDDFLDIKTTSNKRIEEIEKNLGNLSNKYSEISALLPKALERVSKLESFYRNGTTEDKRQIISSMFPEKIVFDGKKHRTPKVNSGLLLIYQKQSELEQIKNRTNRKKNDLSRMVHPTRFELISMVPETTILSIELRVQDL